MSDGVRLVDEFAFRDLQRAVNKVAGHEEAHHREVTESIEALETDVRDLRTDLEGLDRRHEEHVTQTGSSLDALAARLTRVEVSLTRTVAYVGWIQRHVQLKAGAVTADLDAVRPETRERGRRVVRAREARASLVPVADQDAAQAAVDSLELWRRQMTEATQDLDAAARAGERTSDSAVGATVDRVRDAYKAADEHLQSVRANGAAIRDSAATGQRRLADAAALEAQHAQTIRVGDKALQQLEEELRASIVTMLNTDALPPMWFSLTFGHQPAGDVDTWLDLATQVLAYRVCYGVTDDVQPVGPDAVETSSQRQLRDHLAEGIAML